MVWSAYEMIYLDHAAATPLDPRVLEAMMPYLTADYGNPSSIYKFGQRARRAIDLSREKIAATLACSPREILFTSGGTESNNLFLRGVAEARAKNGRHIITSKIEHESVLKPLEYLQAQGFEVSFVGVGEDGIVEVDNILRLLRPDTILISIMYANNEIGTIQPIAEIARALKQRYAEHKNLEAPFFHTDACQAAPFLSLSVKELGVDAMTINAGKIYGPKGTGALFVREGIELVPQLFGGGQEYRKRSGTENVAGIVGMAKALELVQADRRKEAARLVILRDMLIDGLLKIPNTRLNGDRLRRLPNNVNISFKGLEGEAVLLRLDMLDVAASSGSACTSGSLEPSHVVRALGVSEEWTHSSTRFSLGRHTTEDEVHFVVKNMPKIIEELGEVSPFN